MRPAAPLPFVASRAAISQLSAAQRPLQPKRFSSGRSQNSPGCSAWRRKAAASLGKGEHGAKDLGRSGHSLRAAGLRAASHHLLPAPSAHGERDVHTSTQASVSPEAKVAVVLGLMWHGVRGRTGQHPRPCSARGLWATGVFPVVGRHAPSKGV